MKISIIVAASDNQVIGVQGVIPWYIPEDLKYFKRMTLGKPIIMGRKTWESLPIKPLPKRSNIIITRQDNYSVANATVCSSFGTALAEAYEHDADEAFVIGGSQIYKQALDAQVVDRVYMTHVHTRVERGDAFFPRLDERVWIRKRGKIVTDTTPGAFSYSFETYDRK